MKSKLVRALNNALVQIGGVNQLLELVGQSIVVPDIIPLNESVVISQKNQIVLQLSNGLSGRTSTMYLECLLTSLLSWH